MNVPQSYQLNFIAAQDFIEHLKDYATQNPQNLEIKSEKHDEDATKLGFDLLTVATVLTITQAGLYIGELATKIVMWLRKSKSDKIVIQTPFQTIEIRKEGITEEYVREVLKAAQDIS